MVAQANDPLGFGLFATLCNVVLPFPDGNGGRYMQTVQAVQLTLGIGTDPGTGKVLPSVASGRQKLAGDLLLRLSTSRGTLPDTKIPTTTASYGFDILDALNADMTARDVGMLNARIDSQCKADERVANSATAIVVAGDVAMVPILITDGKGPFRLTLTANLLTGNLSLFAAP